MSFRVRVVVATAVAVSLAVTVASGTALLVARHAVMQAVDESLIHAATQQPVYGTEEDRVQGAGFELVLADGTVLSGRGFPVDDAVLAVAREQSGHRFITVEAGNATLRELVVPVPAGTEFPCGVTECQLTQNAAQVFMTDITGQRHQLQVLAVSLLLVTIVGLLLASGLGYLAAAAALRPLESVTGEIEEIATERDLSARIDDGGSDELGRLRRTFNKLMNSVDSSQRLQRQLVMDASHELRTPLTSLRTNAQVLASSGRLDEAERQQIVGDMIVQINELSSLITDLGELTRGERSEEKIVELRLDELVEEAVAIARTHARTKGITIDYVGSATTAELRHDRMVRAVNNLLSNAIKFTPENGTISVTCREGTITVSDSGPGIPSDERTNVFDRFWRSPSARALPGSGLGLSIVAQVIREAGGTITVTDSAELGGASFIVTIPAIKEGN